ncbi:MAG: hypothetical protein CSA23_01075 [Deltaproteobacteria bacterium]|nr:MAG: hypothetical protein CSA23_01075 [Deltaproteobacteria bacterium]
MRCLANPDASISSEGKKSPLDYPAILGWNGAVFAGPCGPADGVGAHHQHRNRPDRTLMETTI